MQKVTPPGRPANVRIPEGHADAFAANFARDAREVRVAAVMRAAAMADAPQAP